MMKILRKIPKILTDEPSSQPKGNRQWFTGKLMLSAFQILLLKINCIVNNQSR
ncbi:MAG: hypothetical protein NTW69_19945 [Chloroflexi bacterium]|nr:hypothetical protein [Chloroflexota bacterium]